MDLESFSKKMAESLRDRRREAKVSTAEAARLAVEYAAKEGRSIKLSQQSISAFEQGGAKRIPSWLNDVMRPLNAIVLGKISDGSEHAFDRDDDSVKIRELPTFAGAGGGGTGEGDEATLSFSGAIVRQELRADADDLLAVTIEGNSMFPDYQPGDRLLVDKRKTSLAQPGAFCLWDGDGYVVKFIERVPGSEPPKIRVISANPIFSTFERLVEEVRIMGRVVWLARKV